MFRSPDLFKHKLNNIFRGTANFKKEKVGKLIRNDLKKIMASSKNCHKPLCIFLSTVMMEGASQSALLFRIFPVLIFRDRKNLVISKMGKYEFGL